MKPDRVLLLVHESLVPPERKLSVQDREASECKTESDILHTLKELGHEVRVLGVYDSLKAVKAVIEEFQPDIVFNLLEEFAGEAIYDSNFVSFLELMNVPYTGCNPRGLMLARDKALSKEILHFHQIQTPEFQVFMRGSTKGTTKDAKFRTVEDSLFPAIVKSLNEEASLGISQASVVKNVEELRERVLFLQKEFHTDVIAEKFIEGREIYVGVMGDSRLSTFEPWELHFEESIPSLQRLATRKVKFNEKHRKVKGYRYGRARGLSESLESELSDTAKRVYRGLKLSGYARVDFRVTDKGEIYFIEANPNPDIAQDEEFAESVQSEGVSYSELIQNILNLGYRNAEDV